MILATFTHSPEITSRLQEFPNSNQQISREPRRLPWSTSGASTILQWIYKSTKEIPTALKELHCTQNLPPRTTDADHQLGPSTALLTSSQNDVIIYDKDGVCFAQCLARCEEYDKHETSRTVRLKFSIHFT
jgi:hypothetical protein